MSGKRFWKQPLKGVVENDVLKALKVLEARNFTKNDLPEHLSAATSGVSCICNFVSNICIKYLLPFFQINLRRD